MELTRKPFQGVWNIVRFNWHFYAVAGLMLFALLGFRQKLPDGLQSAVMCLATLALLTIGLSLLVSYYVYDYSGLYQLHWLPDIGHRQVLHVNAGFDETSSIVRSKFPGVSLTVCDFYNPEKHTEISIKRARKAYPPTANTIPVPTDQLPFRDASFDYVLAILAAHEIRDEAERVRFFAELHRVTKNDGQIFVTEHLRDLNNFMAYTIGFLHFHTERSWRNTFAKSKLSVKSRVRSTPFVTTFILEKHGDTL